MENMPVSRTGVYKQNGELISTKYNTTTTTTTKIEFRILNKIKKILLKIWL
jgi:hypothetical protein